MSVGVFKNYINSEWVGGETFENRNPADTDEVVGLFVKGSKADIAAAALVRDARTSARGAAVQSGGHSGSPA
jgi:aldehyde dehydrogenase (NAD+)